MKTKKAWFVDMAGRVTRLPELEGKELKLSSMYEKIDCSTIEHVALKKGVDMWIDEEGLMKDLTFVNEKATAMYREAHKDNHFVDLEQLVIVGNAIITDNTKAGDYIK